LEYFGIYLKVTSHEVMVPTAVKSEKIYAFLVFADKQTYVTTFFFFRTISVSGTMLGKRNATIVKTNMDSLFFCFFF